MVSLLFQIEGGGLFPRAVQDDGIHVGAPGAVDVPFCREVHVRRRADGFVPVQDRQEGHFPFFFVGNDRIEQAFLDPADVLFQFQFAVMLSAEVHLFSHVPANDPQYLGKQFVPGMASEPGASGHGCVRSFVTFVAPSQQAFRHRFTSARSLFTRVSSRRSSSSFRES